MHFPTMPIALPGLDVSALVGLSAGALVAAVAGALGAAALAARAGAQPARAPAKVRRARGDR